MKSLYQSTQSRFGYPFFQVFDTLVNLIPGAGLRITHIDRTAGCITAQTGGFVPFSAAEVTFVVQVLRKDVTIVRMETALRPAMLLRSPDRHKQIFEQTVSALSLRLPT
jgi:hypothetical protein